MSTDKNTRAAPPRIFEQYTLSLDTTGGLTNIDERAFMPCSPAGFGADPGKGFVGASPGFSVLLPIGFDFNIDGIVYKKFVVSTSGWMVLADPGLDTFFEGEVMTAIDDNTSIKPTFTSQAVLLAPWFAPAVTIASDESSIVESAYWSVAKGQRQLFGREPRSILLDETRFGVKYANCSTHRGRCLVVRWNVFLSLDIAPFIGQVVRFEVVIYENGTIEFRYDALDVPDTSLQVFNGTIGIFMPNGTNRFRDFSYGLGHRDTERTLYRYGGVVYDAAYTELSVNFTCLLSAVLNWPSRGVAGALFSFSPPKNRRKILPRLALQDRDAAASTSLLFDDRLTHVYNTSSTNVTNFPTSLDNFFGFRTSLREETLDLFIGGIEVTGSTSRSASDDFVRSTSNTSLGRDFNEACAPTTSPDSLFKDSRSDIEQQLGLGMSQPISAKTRIKLSLAVNNSLTMFGASSSIYYYNKTTSGWNVPQNSSYILAPFVSAPPAGSKADIARFDSYVTQSLFFEDARGFNALGGVVSSGSNVSGQTDTGIGAPFVRSEIIDTLSKVYSKSVQLNPEYAAAQDELISLPITRPFVIEKIVFELPVTAGPGWFNDTTQVFHPIESGALSGSLVTDLAGPALTLSVFNQISPTRRDLIASGTITHTFDDTSNVVFANFPPLTSTYHIRQTGFRAFGATPSSVVTPSYLNSYFTGTVVVPMTAQISNGVTLFLERQMNFATPALMRSGVLALFNSPTLVLEEIPSGTLPEYTQHTRNVFVNGFGRGASGFEPSGRSVFGKEFASRIGTDSVKNPFYVSGAKGGLTLENLGAYASTGDIPLQFSSSLTGGSKFIAYTAFALDKCLPSPYLVYPGDKLVIAISKTRPAFYGDATPAPHTSGSILHDISLMTGTLGVTFYGSHLKEGVEYHETHDVPLNTVSIHETNAGAEPVLDQFDVEYAETYVGGISDDFVTGSLVDVVTTFRTGASRTLVTGSRGRVFSTTDIGNDADYTDNRRRYPQSTSVAYNTQPLFEFAGTTRIAQCVSTERYYDSLMPALDTCFKADSASICISDSTIVSTFLGLTDLNVGLVVLNVTGFGTLDEGRNNDWSQAYPFEPRYSLASRLINIKSSFTATRAFNAGAISPRPTGGLVIVFPGIDAANLGWLLFVDSTALNSTSSMSNDDALKVLYGFGDTKVANILGGGRLGHNFPTFRKKNAPFAAYAPIIRGWKHGVHSALPTYSKVYFRRGHFGQFRDMLEQRPYTKYYQLTDINNIGDQEGVKTAAVNITFVDSVSGSLTAPENTTSSNLSFEATSSMPYLDGVSRNRSSESLI